MNWFLNEALMREQDDCEDSLRHFFPSIRIHVQVYYKYTIVASETYKFLSDWILTIFIVDYEYWAWLIDFKIVISRNPRFIQREGAPWTYYHPQPKSSLRNHLAPPPPSYVEGWMCSQA